MGSWWSTFLDPDLLKQQIENGVDYYGMKKNTIALPLSSVR
ncbi:MAG: hypothetical protein ACLU4J_11045 [Butyricimonas paravirosa]